MTIWKTKSAMHWLDWPKFDVHWRIVKYWLPSIKLEQRRQSTYAWNLPWFSGKRKKKVNNLSFNRLVSRHVLFSLVPIKFSNLHLFLLLQLLTCCLICSLAFSLVSLWVRKKKKRRKKKPRRSFLAKRFLHFLVRKASIVLSLSAACSSISCSLSLSLPFSLFYCGVIITPLRKKNAKNKKIEYPTREKASNTTMREMMEIFKMNYCTLMCV